MGPCIGSNNLQACAINGLQQLGANMPVILTRLNNAFEASSSPVPPIVGMEYYNPLLSFYLPGGDAQVAALSEFLLPQINGVLANTFDSFGGTTADAYTAIHGDNSELSNSGVRNDIV